MINMQSETILTLSEAANRLPKRRRGKRPHVATMYRWARNGLRGTRLEVIQVGGSLCTSSEAVQRFFEMLTKDNAEMKSVPMNVGSSYERAQRELKEMGF